MEVLLKHGADINIAGSVGDRPLHLACGKGYVRVTQLLVEGTSKQKADGKVFGIIVLGWYIGITRSIFQSIFLVSATPPKLLKLYTVVV